MNEPLRLPAAFNSTCDQCLASIPRGAVLVRLALDQYCCARCHDRLHRQRRRMAGR